MYCVLYANLVRMSSLKLGKTATPGMRSAYGGGFELRLVIATPGIGLPSVCHLDRLLPPRHPEFASGAAMVVQNINASRELLMTVIGIIAGLLQKYTVGLLWEGRASSLALPSQT
jgi:hypothetical protein